VLLRVSALFLQIIVFEGWAMLGSNQRPLPCEGSTIVCWRFLELAKCLQIVVFVYRHFSQGFRIFTRVAARLLHRSLAAVHERHCPRDTRARPWCTDEHGRSRRVL
jgi:hypothetical protein